MYLEDTIFNTDREKKVNWGTVRYCIWQESSLWRWEARLFVRDSNCDAVLTLPPISLNSHFNWSRIFVHSALHALSPLWKRILYVSIYITSHNYTYHIYIDILIRLSRDNGILQQNSTLPPRKAAPKWAFSNPDNQGSSA